MASSPPPSSSPPPPNKRLKMSSTASDDEAEDECRNESAEAPPHALPSSAGEPKRRYKRRKVAIFLAYCGAGYQGMQKNPGARTIEGDLEEALFLSGAVPEPDRGKPRRYDWARAARTDKGVSAAGQVVSGRFYVDPPGFIDRLNGNLPAQIRAFGYRRVTASFNAKKFCDRRRYVYLLPVFALDPNAHPDRESVLSSLGSENELAKCLECSERGRKVVGLMGRQASKACKQGNEEERTHVVTVGEAIERGGDETRTGQGGSQSELTPVSSDSSVVKAVDVVGHGDEMEKGITTVKEEQAATVNSSEEEMIRTDPPVSEEEAKPNPAAEESKIGDEPNTGTRVSTTEETTGAPQNSGGNGEHAPAIAGDFKYGEEEEARFNAILKRYVGTHNFHNFTTRTKAEDPSARRYIVSFDAGTVVGMGGIDFVRCEVVGQSFMLHQIRKMIGLAVAIMRNCTPESMMDTALRKDVNINVPTAPEVGLYLDECLFTSYNQKWKDSHEAVSMEAFAEQAEEFRVKHIFSHIAAMEQQEGAVALWLHSLNHRNYPDFRFADEAADRNAEEGAQTDGIAEVEMS